MSFTRGTEYERADIASGLGLSDAMHAVLVKDGRAVAIVVTASGLNPYNGKKYLNKLTDDDFAMQGENDDRGDRSEDAGSVHLFFLHAGGSGYRYEGKIRHLKTTNYLGEILREFKRLPENSPEAGLAARRSGEAKGP